MSTVKIDTLLYETKILKTVLMDNYAIKQNEFRPLDEFHEIMKQHARDYAKILVTSQLGIHLSDEVLELHEKEFYI